jgi:enoyl-CoA hydratase/carnithine racemase
MSVVNPAVRFEDYREKYQHIRLERRDGIVQMTFHSRGGPFKMSGLAHAEAADAFYHVGADHENRVVIVTGTGDSFCDNWERGSFDKSTGEAHARIHYEGRRLLQNLLDVESIVISAVNGPSIVHSFPVVADICLCSDDATFQDNHVAKGGVPVGDGANVIWQHLLGPTRGKYFLLLGQLLSAQEALQLGVVNEVLPRAALLQRAWALAEELVKRPATTLRYSRLILNQHYRRLMLDELPGSYALQKLGQATNTIKPLDGKWG